MIDVMPLLTRLTARVKRQSGEDKRQLGQTSILYAIERSLFGLMKNWEAALQAEIQFWHEMIKLRRGSVPSETLGRMEDALKLAQKKLWSRQEDTNQGRNK